jgi:hypothetical protein
MSVSIGLDAVRELRQPRICRDFGPTRQVELGLRLEIRELDRDRHAGNIRQKWKKTTGSQLQCLGALEVTAWVNNETVSEAGLPFTLGGSRRYHLHDRDFTLADRQVRSTQ